MKTILILSFLMLSILGYTQQHNYSYDASGNRIKREYIILDVNGNPLRMKALKDTLVFDLKAYPNPLKKQVILL